MTKDESLKAAAVIARAIAEGNSTVEYGAKTIKKAKQTYSEDKLAELCADGYIDSDDKHGFEKFYTVKRFLDKINLREYADEDYIKRLFAEARRFDTAKFNADPYMKCVKCGEVKVGKFLLTNAHYDAGEFFQYDMPNLDGEVVVPKIGYFDGRVSFLSIYEGNMPWMSVCPSEINSMRGQMDAAHGKVLVLGLGLGYYPFVVSAKENVSEITIVELSDTIADIFEKHLLPQFPHKDKIKVVRADAFDYLETLHGGEYDFCFADIWEGLHDGVPLYLRIREYEKRLPETEFTYWIEKEMKADIESRD